MPYIIFAVFCLLIIFLFYRWATRKQRRREKLSKQEFPAEWRQILENRVGFYHTLSDEKKLRFEKLIQIFIAEKRIIGIKTEVDATTRVLVAASAIIPIFGFDNWEYDNLGEVFVTQGAVNTHKVDEQVQNIIAGQVQPFQNQHYMILSKNALEQGFNNMKDRTNVGIHEFAHLLDEADGEIDGIPKAYLPPELIKPWTELMHRKMQDIKEGKNQINSYGATSEAEFFAVVTEYFFEDPVRLKQNHPDMYALLTKTFHQNPRKRYSLDFNELLNPNYKKMNRNAPCPCGSGEKYKNCCWQESHT
jgi:Mlc titration factor MtfA (ptsG expression regulator)